MKKTLSINISGFVFHIDEDAYEKLHRYLEAIKSHFKGFEGREEVISDVEARIAEILQKKISDSKEVVTLEDVGEVIAIMGQPSDFAMNEEAPGDSGPAGYSSLPKRLYRDPERKVIGGVCSGLGAYFNLAPVWVRIIFIFSILISGFGLLLYLILWIVVPEARTTSERLEMKGEPINISNIEKSIGDEVHHLKDKVNDFAAKAKHTYRKQKEEFKSNHRDQFLDSLGDIGSVIVRIILIFLGIFILIIGIGLTVVYLSILFHIPVITLFNDAGVHIFPLYAITGRIFENDTDLRTISTGLMILFGIPLLMMLWAGIRLIFNLPRAKFISGLAGIVWICALVITMVFGLKVSNSFRNMGEFTRESVLNISKTDTLHIITMRSLPKKFEWDHSGVLYFPELRFAISEDEKIFNGIPLLKIEPSNDSVARLIVNTSARGSFVSEASERAERINYPWTLKNDTLRLSDSFVLPEGDQWRKQEAKIEVQLPAGTVLSIDEDSYPILDYHKNYSRREMTGTLFMMDNSGLVKCGK